VAAVGVRGVAQALVDPDRLVAQLPDTKHQIPERHTGYAPRHRMSSASGSCNLPLMGRRILFLGPPGAGKGTQAAMIARAIGVPHISTGVMLRAAVTEGTELGRQAEVIMAKGDLVPDELVVAMVAERLSADDARCGYLLDGFPRNVEQAEALVAEVGVDALEIGLLLDVDEEELVKRLLGRAEDLGRDDDNEDTIRRRLEVYRRETEPLVAFYPERGMPVVPVDGMGDIDEVFARLVRALADASAA
jgi:adenylate kinase